MLPTDTLALLCGFVAVLALGHLLRRTGRLPAHSADTLNVVVTDVTMPALILATLSARPVPEGALRAIGVSWIGLAVGLALGALTARLLGLGRPARGAVSLTSGFSNTGFLGIPLVLGLYPDTPEAGMTAVLLDAFVTTLWLYTAGVFWARRQGGGGAGDQPRLLRLLLSPATVAVLLGLAMSVFHLALPPPIARLATLLGGATVPMVFLALGIRLDLGSLRGRGRSLLAVALVRQLVAPAAVLLVATAAGLRGPVREVTVLQAAMPSAMMAAVVADRYGCDGPLGTGAVVLTMLLSVIALPTWIAALRLLGH